MRRRKAHPYTAVNGNHHRKKFVGCQWMENRGRGKGRCGRGGRRDVAARLDSADEDEDDAYQDEEGRVPPKRRIIQEADEKGKGDDVSDVDRLVMMMLLMMIR